MKSLLTLLCILSWACPGFGQGPSGEEMAAFDSLFQAVTPDTIHLYTGRFILEEDSVNTAILGQRLPEEFVKTYMDELPEDGSFATLKFNPDSAKNYTSYLIFVPRELRQNHTLYLYVWSDSLKDFVDDQVVASYLYLEGATEQIRNSWVIDLDADGVRDVGQYSQLIDFEWPTPDMPNVTGSEQYSMLFKEGKFDFDIWNGNILERFPLKK